MPALDRAVVFNGLLSGATGPVARGIGLLYDEDAERLVIATDANRTATGRKTAGIALTEGDDDLVEIEVQFAGPVDPSITGLGTGTATTVYINSSGAMARGGTVGVHDIIGRCDTDGTAYIMCGGIAGAAGGANIPGGAVNSVQFHASGDVFDGAEDVVIDDEQLGLNASAGDLPDIGALRIATGGLNAFGFEFRMRGVDHDGTTPRDIGLLYGYSASGFPSPANRNVVGIGDADNTANLCPDHFRIHFNRTTEWSFTTLTPQSTYVGAGLGLLDSNDEPVTGFSERRVFYLSRHTNFAMFGARSTISDAEDALGTGEGVAYFGYAEANPSTNPTQGVTFYVDSGDGNIKWRKADGTTVVPIDTITNVGAGETLAKAKSGINVDIKSLVAGSNITLTPGANDVTITAASTGAPTTAQYVTLATDATLSNERVLTAGTNISITDGGAGSTVTVAFSAPGTNNQLYYRSSGTLATTSDWTYSTGLVGGSGTFVSLNGGTVHSSAFIRFAYNSGSSQVLMGVKDNVGTDRTVVGFGGGNALAFGNSAMNLFVDGAASQFNGSSSLLLSCNGSSVLNTTGSDIQLSLPIAGSQALGLPLRFKVARVTISADPTTLTAAQYECPIILLDGSISAYVNMPSNDGGWWCIHNDGSGILSIRRGGSGGVVDLDPDEAAVCFACATEGKMRGVVSSALT